MTESEKLNALVQWYVNHTAQLTLEVGKLNVEVAGLKSQISQASPETDDKKR